MHVTYELYAHKKGRWMVDSVFDEREMAIFEAKNLIQSPYVSGVKVDQETHDPSTGKITAVTVFSERKGEESKVSKRSQAAEKQEAAKSTDGDTEPRRRRKRRRRKKKKGMPEWVRAILVLTGVTGVGLGLWYLILLLGQSM